MTVTPPTADKVYGLQLVKLRTDLTASRGLNAERAFTHALERAHRPPVAVLGTLGWSDLVVLVEGETVSDVASQLFRTANAHIPGEITPEKPGLKTFSMLAFAVDDSGSYMVPDTVRREAIRADASSCIPRAHVDCPAWAWEDVARALKRDKVFTTVDRMLGPTDILLRTRVNGDGAPTTWGQVVDSLAQLRDNPEVAAHVRGTELVVTQPMTEWDAADDGGESPASRVSPSEPAVMLSEEETRDILQLASPIGELVVNAIYTFNSHVADPVMAGTFADMVPFVNAMKLRARDSSDRRRLPGMLESFKNGLEQRAAGCFVSLGSPTVKATAVQGSCEVLLRAAHELVLRLWPEDVAPWNGFVTVAAPSGWHSSESDVLNVPLEALHDPTALWPVVHEVVHLAAESSYIANPARLYTLLELFGLAATEDLGDTLHEIAADLHVFYRSFKGDFSRYLTCMFGLDGLNRIQDHAAILEQFLMRLFCVWFVGEFNEDKRAELAANDIWIRLTDPDTDPFERFEVLRDTLEVSRFWEALEAHPTEFAALGLQDEVRVQVEYDIPVILPFLEYLDTTVREACRSSSPPGDTVAPALQDLANGFLLDSLDGTDLALLLGELATYEYPSARHRMRADLAFVLTLWDAAANRGLA